ncbi:acyltransferase family protein [Weissella confusa]|uniref:acyltransferase family protein n=1 Tax=Weissella confusa TaxID=1583 RepID=UPI00223AB3F0|nr:acyltransferase [Weissella confusa]MCS9990596.1 acyltransferase [Weissella confusa]
MENKKIRKSNFEALRVVAMLMIIMFHSVIDIVTTPKGSPLATNPEVVGAMRFIMDFFGNGGVTLFAMISGYFLISSKNDQPALKRASDSAVKFAGLALYNGVVVTTVIALALAVINKLNLVNLDSILPDNIFTDLNTVFGFAGGYWYLSAYFVLLIFLKPLNNFLNNLKTRSAFFYLLGVVVFASTIINYVPLLTVRDGVNFPLVFIGYLLGAFARKFNPLQNFSNKVLLSFLALYPAYFIGSFEFLVRVLHVAPRIANPAVGYYVGFPIYIFSFVIFTLFMRLNFTSKFVNFIAPATVFVYMFHTATPYGMFYRISAKIYIEFSESFGIANHWLILALPLVVLLYAVITMAFGSMLYYVYEFAASRVTKRFKEKIGVA